MVTIRRRAEAVQGGTDGTRLGQTWRRHLGSQEQTVFTPNPSELRRTPCSDMFLQRDVFAARGEKNTTLTECPTDNFQRETRREDRGRSELPDVSCVLCPLSNVAARCETAANVSWNSSSSRVESGGLRRNLLHPPRLFLLLWGQTAAHTVTGQGRVGQHVPYDNRDFPASRRCTVLCGDGNTTHTVCVCCVFGRFVFQRK